MTRPLRFIHSGGEILSADGSRVTLATAGKLAKAWGLLAIRWQDQGCMEFARHYARSSLDIGLAASAALAWRRASGCINDLTKENIRADW